MWKQDRALHLRVIRSQWRRRVVEAGPVKEGTSEERNLARVKPRDVVSGVGVAHTQDSSL